MSESDFKRIRLHLRLLTICVIALIILLIASLIHGTLNPTANSFPKIQAVNGKNGKNAQIDYDKVNQLIEAQVATLPKPQNGANGQSIQGQQGIPGIGVQGLAGKPGVNGKDGRDGVDGLTLQIQVNPDTCQLQSKYTVSDVWNILAQLPKPCEVL